MPPLPHPNATQATTLTAELMKQLALETDLTRAVIPTMLSLLVLLDTKQRDYGPHNLIKFGPFGVIVRANDKMERLNTLAMKEQKRFFMGEPKDEPLHESMEDTLLDLANYALIAYVMKRGLWPRKS